MKILKRNNWFFHAVSNEQRFLCVTINMQVLVIYTQSARITTTKTLFIFSYSVNCEGHIPWSAHKYTDTGNLLRNYLNFHLNKICWEGKKRKLSCNRNKERGAALGKVYIKFMKNGNWGESLISSKVLSLKKNKLFENIYYISRLHRVVYNNYVS